MRTETEHRELKLRKHRRTQRPVVIWAVRFKDKKYQSLQRKGLTHPGSSWL